MSTTVTSTIDIAASPEAVWDVLTDFAAYSEWNPFMDRIEGVAVTGQRLVVHMSPPGGRGMTFRPTVLAATGRELRWLGTLPVRRLFDGEHSFVLTSTDEGATRLVHSEEFRGLLVSLLKGTTKGADAGFSAFNEALKERVEARHARQAELAL